MSNNEIGSIRIVFFLRPPSPWWIKLCVPLCVCLCALLYSSMAETDLTAVPYKRLRSNDFSPPGVKHKRVADGAGGYKIVPAGLAGGDGDLVFLMYKMYSGCCFVLRASLLLIRYGTISISSSRRSPNSRPQFFGQIECFVSLIF